MRLNSLWTAGLAACVFTTLCGSARAEGAGDARARQGAHRATNEKLLVETPTGQPARRSSRIPYLPLPSNTVFQRDTVQLGDGSGGVSAGGEQLVYENVNGRFVIPLRANQLVADDLTLVARKGCKVRRFTFQVTGRADPSGIGGPFRVNFSVYNTCPQAGGIPVAGLSGQVDFGDDGAHDVIVDVTGDAVLPRTTVWLAVRFNRNNCGIVMGSPPLKGFSADIFDYPLLNCNAELGGFPNFPHASFNATVYADAACENAFPGYRNVAPEKPGHSFGAGLRYADDLEMSVQTCDLIGYEIGVKGQAAYNIDLRRDAGNFPGSVIEGTQTQVLSIGSNIQVYGYEIDPPIHLAGAPIRVWMTVRPNLSTGKWIRTGRNAQVGNTAASLARETAPDSGIWQIVFPDEPEIHGGYFAVLTCAGQPPIGACCDMYVTDAQGDAVCRTVPKMNCPFPPRGSALMPPWEEGVSCRVCDGGCRDGLGCQDDSECTGSPAGECFDGTCVGGCNDNEACFTNEDCLGSTNGTCVPNQPFRLPCGQSACCTPQDECINLTRSDCFAIEPLYKPRQWQAGQFCGLTPGQRCPDSSCLSRTGACTEARDRICNGGDHDGATCVSSSECRGDCFLNVCIGGCRDGAACTTDLDCNCDGVCDDETDPNDPRCVGGARAGEFCDPDRGNFDCWESYCELFPGCEDPECCTAVCDYAPGFPLYTEFCCQTEWDPPCAELARDTSLGLCPGIRDANDTCAPTSRTKGAAPLGIGGDLISGGRSMRDIGADPGACCHQGLRVCSDGCRKDLQCMIDEDCPGAAAGTCSGTTCVGGCRAGQNCTTDDDCPGAPPGTCVLPAEPAPNGPVYGTHWYSFTVPPASSPDDPETVSLQVDTCTTPNDPDTWDSLIEVFSVADSDRGKCTGLGRCNDLTVCVSNDDCTDGSQCRAAEFQCSISADDCPLGVPCNFDLDAACDKATSLTVIGCNDDALDGCGGGSRTRLSKLCLSDLERGNTYLVMVGGKRETDIQGGDPGNVVDYRTRLTPVSSCTVQGGGDVVSNDYCRKADLLPFHPTNEILRNFDLSGATWDCVPSDTECPSMQNDVWYEYRPDFSGTTTFEACGPDDPSTPNVCLAVYDGCDCPPPIGATTETCGCLNLGNQECTLGAKVRWDVIGGQCYKVRVSDNRGVRGEATLSVRFEQGDCNGNDIPDNCEVSCGVEGDACFGVPGCGTAEDCNGNLIPDTCDILIAEGGFCDPGQRLDCSSDENMDGRPDECPNCPLGPVEFIDPPDGVVAAGYPADPGTPGCDAAGISRLVVNAPSGAEQVCWRVCETADTGSANFVAGAVENPPGTYELTLGRPITPGACTTISYTNNNNITTTGTFTAHPADTNADGVANVDDITFLVDVLMGTETAPWGAYSSDVDLDGASIFPDLLGVVDLLDGNGDCFDPWTGSTPVSCDACLPQ